MNEKLLQYIWDRQLYAGHDLRTADGESIEVMDRGRLNRDQGPDFLGAVLKIAGMVWAGHVELHLQTKDWLAHGHQNDRGYDNVILHVVWEHTGCIDPDIPVLALKERVPHFLLERYAGWMGQLRMVPCEEERNRQGIHPADGWLEQLMDERLRARSEWLESRRVLAGGDWEEIFWWQIARSFGHHVNADAFEELARGIPLKLLGRHRGQIHQLEALLLGQSQLLNGRIDDPYVILLQKEYRHLRHKLSLSPIRTPMKFLRMRPLNFPTVRLAQLAMLIHTSDRWFSQIREMDHPSEAEALLSVTANDFWHYHYRLEKSAGFVPKTLGRPMIRNIIINTIVPMMHAHGSYMQEPAETRKAVEWLRRMSAEENAATRLFASASWHPANALESQAILELEKNYCQRKRCLDCDLGKRLLSGLHPLVPEEYQSANSA